MNPERKGAVAWALGTFHAGVLVLVLVLLTYRSAGLGALLSGLDTLTGLVIFTALWATSVWTTRHPLAEGVWLSATPADRAVFFGQALRWGAATGTLFLAELGAIFLLRTIITAPDSIQVFSVVAFGLIGGVIGMLFAFVIGAVVGVTLGGFDLVALAMAQRIRRPRTHPGS